MNANIPLVISDPFLNQGIRGFKDHKVVWIPAINNAYGETVGLFSRDVFVNQNIAVDLPVEDGLDASGQPQYRMERVPFEIVLWHELIGHAINGAGHPAEQWNTYDDRNLTPLPKKWGTVDPTIIYENMARIKLGLSKRRPQYYNIEADWPK